MIISLHNTDWFLYDTFDLLKTRGHYMYRQFNIQQFYVPPTQCIYAFCMDLRTKSHYFPTELNNYFLSHKYFFHSVNTNLSVNNPCSQ